MNIFSLNTHHAYLNNDIILRCNGAICVEDMTTGQDYQFENELKIKLCAGKHVLVAGEQQEEVFIEDAIKLGGGRIKNAFVFDDSPWIFVTTKDRLYITNKDTKEEQVEYNITPDSISVLGRDGKPCDYFLFQTNGDFSIYDVLHGKSVFKFSNHIYSNDQIVIYREQDTTVIYDYQNTKILAIFKGQYSLGNQFYFVQNEKLYSLDLITSDIHLIDKVGNMNEEDILTENHLLKLENDNVDYKEYAYYSLGQEEQILSKTEIKLPYYIDKWENKNLNKFQEANNLCVKFRNEHKDLLQGCPDLKNICFGIRINQVIEELEGEVCNIILYGEIVANPSICPIIPFKLKGVRGEKLYFYNGTIEPNPQSQNCVDNNSKDETEIYKLNVGEVILAKSVSGKLLITKENDRLFLCYLECGIRREILNDFDSSSYKNAFFTSDGRNVVLQVNDTEGKMLGIDNFNLVHFEVDGFTVAKNEGFNGYNLEFDALNNRLPVWRDPISLQIVPRHRMSKRVYMSPDGKYSADINMKTVLFNRLSQSEMTDTQIAELREKYNWSSDTKDDEKKQIIERRKQLEKSYTRNVLFERVINQWANLKDNENKKEVRITQEIDEWINKKAVFTKLFVDRLSYVCYRECNNNINEKRILIGRNVYFLNYVSFSYDSKYLSFAAKMNEDEWRCSQEGVCVIYDLEKEVVVNRIEDYQKQQLYAVWMSMFSKKGDVAFYDSHANAYLLRQTDNYHNLVEAQGKSLLCFSPSGEYVACSNQNYIDYTHHPNENWGHQPSGNVYIHTADNFEKGIAHYNDLGEGVEGVASRAGNVASAAFSQDEKLLLVVGSDGVVVIRNLHLPNR